MLKPMDTVQVNDKYPDLAYLKGQIFRIGSMGTVCGTKVVWLCGHGAPVSCIAADAVEKVNIPKGENNDTNT